MSPSISIHIPPAANSRRRRHPIPTFRQRRILCSTQSGRTRAVLSERTGTVAVGGGGHRTRKPSGANDEEGRGGGGKCRRASEEGFMLVPDPSQRKFSAGLQAIQILLRQKVNFTILNFNEARLLEGTFTNRLKAGILRLNRTRTYVQLRLGAFRWVFSRVVIERKRSRFPTIASHATRTRDKLFPLEISLEADSTHAEKGLQPLPSSLPPLSAPAAERGRGACSK